MISEQNLLRRDQAVVNNDFAAYQAAKLRRKNENYIHSLERRINTLEESVKRLQSTIEEMSK
jgi:uncharacterized membrane-anchored protein